MRCKSVNGPKAGDHQAIAGYVNCEIEAKDGIIYEIVPKIIKSQRGDFFVSWPSYYSKASGKGEDAFRLTRKDQEENAKKMIKDYFKANYKEGNEDALF